MTRRRLLDEESPPEVHEKAIQIRTVMEKPEPDSPVEFISSGSTVLNLAGSGKGRGGGWARGRIINFVGDGSSGKTLIALEAAFWFFKYMVGNVSHNFPKVKSIRIIYDNPERVMDFPLVEMYGQEFVNFVTWDECSDTIEDWGRNTTNDVMKLKSGEALLRITDSLDALRSAAGKKRFLEAAKTGKNEEDSYGTEKAKYLSQSFFANICDIMENKDATLIIISQLRENINVSFGEKYHRAGGKALNFYTHQVPWLAEVEKLKKTFKGHEMVYGIRTKAKFKRNKVAKPFREAELILLFDYGLDSIGTDLNWLYGPVRAEIPITELKEFIEAFPKEFAGILPPEEKETEKEKKKERKVNRSDLIALLGRNPAMQDKLSDLVEEEWLYVEENVKPDRPPRF